MLEADESLIRRGFVPIWAAGYYLKPAALVRGGSYRTLRPELY